MDTCADNKTASNIGQSLQEIGEFGSGGVEGGAVTGYWQSSSLRLVMEREKSCE